ncbi:MAG TPA: hypothetical protein VFX50_05700 [Gemmatimonadales bacterium]|nr:hypothetical protein [Gemmatimonadales bacterium]
MVLSTSRIAVRVSRAVAAGRLRPVGLNLYTPRLTGPLDELVRAHVWTVAGMLAPGSVVSFRTALERRPAPDGMVVLVGQSRYDRDLPGLRLRVVRGPGPQPGDEPFEGGLFLASRARALLDALRPSRRRGAVARGLSETEAEALLREERARQGEAALIGLRERAALLAGPLAAAAEYETLARLVAGLVTARPPATATTRASAGQESGAWVGGRGLL